MMNSEPSILRQIEADYQQFVRAVDGLSEEQFVRQVDGKWSTADVMQHLYLSARPVARLLAGPREVLMQWGKTNAPAKAYDTIAASYRNALGTGQKAPATMSPRPEDMQVAKDVIKERFVAVYQALIQAADVWSDNDLDTYQMPHPLLGKLSVREMLYFTSVHTQHHFQRLPAL